MKKSILFIILVVVAAYCMYTTNSNNKTDSAVENTNQTEELSLGVEYIFIEPDIVKDDIGYYTRYKIISKDTGDYYCISIDDKEYRISDMMDFGDMDFKVYHGETSTILLIGSVDYYESIYFIYYFRHNTLSRLGQFGIKQPSDVEDNGIRKISFKLFKNNNEVVICQYLDGDFLKNEKFIIK